MYSAKARFLAYWTIDGDQVVGLVCTLSAPPTPSSHASSRISICDASIVDGVAFASQTLADRIATLSEINHLMRRPFYY